jgi:hypothetical protein
MNRRNKFMIEMLLLGMTLLGCTKIGNDDLFDQEQEQLLLEGDWEIDQSISSETFPDKGLDKVLSNEPDTIENTQIIIEEPEGDAMAALGQNDQQLFYYEEITEDIKTRIDGKSYGETCTIPYEELRYVKVLHWGFDGLTYSGELIVNKSIAEDIVEIFKELYEQEYPIERMVLVDEYDADDNTSMAANNSSAFNYRVIDGTDRISNHSYGLAIDINPRYNPYVRTVDGKTVVTPVNGIEYEDRSLDCPYYIDEEDPCYTAFTERGFTWGGEWKNQKDYQHFQKALE